MLVDVTRDSLKNHPLFTTKEFMESFTSKLKHYGFNHFSYLRLIDDHKRILLSFIPEYSELSIKKKFYKFAFYGPVESYSNGVFLTDFLKLGEVKPALAAHGVSVGCLIIKKHKGYVEQFCYGSSRNDPSLNHFIINNLDLFEASIQEFNNRAKLLLKEYEKAPLYYPRGSETTGLEIYQNCPKTPRINLFTQREQEILQNIRIGLSNKKIAAELNVSYRTIEKHIENMFIKTDSHSRIELLRKRLDGDTIF